jgi:hypothetical protein
MTFPSALNASLALSTAFVLAGLGACGGGGGGNSGFQNASSGGAAVAASDPGAASSATAASTPAGTSANNSGSTATNGGSTDVLKLSTAVESEPVAVDAAGSGMLASAGVAALYMAAARPFLSAALAGAPATTTNCATGGTLATTTSNTGSPGVRAGETATVSFDQCKGQLAVPAISSASAVSGSVSFEVDAVQGVVGSRTANWSYTATETANALDLVSPTATTTFGGAVTFTVSYDAATGNTTTTANAPAISIGRTQQSSSGTTLDGSISVSGLAWTEQDEAATSVTTLTSAGAVSVVLSGVTLAFNVSTPVALTLSNGQISAGTQQLTTADTTETIVAQNASTFSIAVTSGGSTGTWTVSASALAS